MADSYKKASMMRERYLVPVEGTAREAQPNGPPSASPIYKTKLQEPPKDLKPSTLYETFMNSVQKFPNNECLGSRVKKPDGTVGGFRFLSYKEVADQVAQLASGMAAIGIEPKQRVGVFGANSEHWMMSMQACNRMSNHCVPLYDSLGENAIEFIVDHAECTCVFLSSDKFPQFIKALGKIHGPLKAVVYWGDSNPECRQAVKDKGYTLHSFDELKKLGAEKPADPVPPKPEELCTIMYTSGTTGDPKGVMLTHNAVVTACLNADYYCKENGIDFKPPDRLLSYLPLAHIFDRVNEEWFLMMGCAIGYWQGDIMKLLDDITELKPAMFIGVPRVFERIYSRIQGGLKEGSSLKRGIFNWAYNRKLDAMRRGNSYKKAAPLSDALVFKKVAARFGGKVKAVVSGGAPLSPHVEEFLRVIMCTAVVQGYGLTETCAVSFISVTDVFPQIGTVGTPTPLSEMRLESVPEMNYDALDPVEPKGEILIRGASNFNGYYKAQDKTDEVLESDGWFHTGDIGCLTKSGGMQIIDRKKNIFKLAQGEYVAVEKLESTYKKASPVVDQVWVYGNSFKNSLVAVVVPGPGLQSWAKEQNIEGSMEELCKNPKAEQYVLDCLTKEAKADKLKGFETVKAVHLDHRPFTIEEDLLTPTFKLKRPQLLKKYKEQVDAMYSKVN